MNRRNFIEQLAMLTGGLSIAGNMSCNGPDKQINNAQLSQDKFGEILPKRKLGNTGEFITMLTLGGWHIGQMPKKDVEPVIEAAIEGGIRSFDTASAYQGGKSETRLGKYLVPKYRDSVFLATKTITGNAKSAQKNLEESLKRLNTDHLDLWQAHNIQTERDVNFRRDNKLFEYMQKAKQEGKVRFIGFTGHSSYKAHQYCLDTIDGFDTCLMPVNVADPSYQSFILHVIPKLIEKNIALLAMKSLGGGGLFGGKSMGRIPYGTKPSIVPNIISVQDAIQFAWSMPVSSLILGNDNAEMVKENTSTAKAFVKLSENERRKIIKKVSDIASTGSMEWYKSKL